MTMASLAPTQNKDSKDAPLHQQVHPRSNSPVANINNPLADTNTIFFPIHAKNHLKICHLNIRSLMRNIEELRHIIDVSDPVHVIAVSETWLRPAVPSTLVELSGYTFIRNDRIGGRTGGGVGMYILNTLSTRVIENDYDISSNRVEQLWIEIKYRCNKIAIGVVYNHRMSHTKN